jgi:hypothetical protein
MSDSRKTRTRKRNAPKASGIGRKPKRRRTEEVPALPNGWLEQYDEGEAKYHRILSNRSDPPEHKLTHTVMENASQLHVEVLGKHLTPVTTPALSIFNTLPARTSTISKVVLIDKLKMCEGLSDPTLLTLADGNGKLYDIYKNVVGTVQDNKIHHIHCEVLLSTGTCCSSCTKYRQSLKMKVIRQRKSKEKVSLQSHKTRLSLLNTPQKIERIRYHKRQSKALLMQKARMAAKLDKLQEESTVVAAEDLSSELFAILTKENTKCNLPGNNIQHLFWEQQVSCVEVRKMKGTIQNMYAYAMYCPMLLLLCDTYNALHMCTYILLFNTTNFTEEGCPTEGTKWDALASTHDQVVPLSEVYVH